MDEKRISAWIGFQQSKSKRTTNTGNWQQPTIADIKRTSAKTSEQGWDEERERERERASSIFSLSPKIRILLGF